MTIAKIIHFCVPPKQTDQQRRCIARATELHPDWQIKIWVNGEEPDHLRLRQYWSLARSGAQRADLVRLGVIWDMGGIYLDSDIFLERALDPLRHQSFSDRMLCCSEDGINLSNGFFAASSRHPAIDHIISFLELNEPDWTLPPYRTTGPQLFSKLLRYRRDTLILPRSSFYPYGLSEQPLSVYPKTIFGIHEWAASWVEQTTAKRSSLLRPIKHSLIKLIRRLALKVLPGHLQAPQQNRCYPSSNSLVVLHRSGVFLSLDPDDQSVTPSVALHGTLEPIEELFTEQQLLGGDWFIDAGANIGVYSAIAAKVVGPFGRIFAFEANPVTARYIENMAYLNWFRDRVSVLNLALSDGKMDKLVFKGSPKRRGEYKIPSSSEAAFEMHSDREQDEISVQSETLDSFFPIDCPIRLLKIDVEGHEVQLLRGARRLLASRSIGCLLIEFGLDSHQSDWRDFLSELREIEGLGYKPGKLAMRDGTVNVATWPNYASEAPAIGHTTLVLVAPEFVPYARRAI